MNARLTPLLTGIRALAPPVLTPKRLRTKRDDIVGSDRIPPLVPRLSVPIVDEPEEVKAQQKVLARARAFARQENWSALGTMIRKADEAQAVTPGGTPVTLLIAAGAGQDALRAVSLMPGATDDTQALAALGPLASAAEEHNDDHGVTFIVAMAHIAAAQRVAPLRPLHHDGAKAGKTFQTLMRRAGALLDRFDPLERLAPSLAIARCHMLDAEPRGDLRVIDDFADLLDLAPDTPFHFRALGYALLPERFGSYRTLARHALRLAALTEETWGMAAYAWVYLDALARDNGACSTVDPDLLVEGLIDIVEHDPNQHNANVLAAMASQIYVPMDAPDGLRDRLDECFGWIVHEHLREIHPALWGMQRGAIGDFQPTEDSLRGGRVAALAALSDHFADDIADGNRVVIDDDGIRLVSVD